MSFNYERVTSKEEWLTPPQLIKSLGEFDLDPCSPINRPWPTARNHFTVIDDGLRKPWEGRVWLNPPYGDKAIRWIARLAEHNHGTALIFARTETAMFFKYVWPKASAVMFLKGRLAFHDLSGKGSVTGVAPSVLIAYGPSDKAQLERCCYAGKMLPL